MRTRILCGAAALALAIPGVSMAQDMDDDDMADDMATEEMAEMSAEQRAMYDAWPADRRTMYDAWPNTYRVYYWTLTPDQMEGWWVLNDTQRGQVYAMTPQQRTAAWAQIAAQMAGAPVTATTTTTTTATAVPAGSANIRFVSNATVQPVSDTPATGDDLPICTANQQDNCINSWEARKTGTRPLEYWPGRPASEIDEPLPAEDPND